MLDTKQKIILGIVGGVIAIIIGIYLYSTYQSAEDEVYIEEQQIDNTIVEPEDSEEENEIIIHISGAVVNEGIVKMKQGNRIADVIEKAGGLKDGANTEYINLSRKIVDEMVIIIYSDDEVKKYKEEDENIIYIEYICECPDNINDSCINENDTVNTNGVVEEKEEEKDKKDDKISINEASKEELMELPGIGESKAKNIIEYREEFGEFEKLEDIMNVSGIGESAYSKIKEHIKL